MHTYGGHKLSDTEFDSLPVIDISDMSDIMLPMVEVFVQGESRYGICAAKHTLEEEQHNEGFTDEGYEVVSIAGKFDGFVVYNLKEVA